MVKEGEGSIKEELIYFSEYCKTIKKASWSNLTLQLSWPLDQLEFVLFYLEESSIFRYLRSTMFQILCVFQLCVFFLLTPIISQPIILQLLRLYKILYLL